MSRQMVTAAVARRHPRDRLTGRGPAPAQSRRWRRIRQSRQPGAGRSPIRMQPRIVVADGSSRRTVAAGHKSAVVTSSRGNTPHRRSPPRGRSTRPPAGDAGRRSRTVRSAPRNPGYATPGNGGYVNRGYAGRYVDPGYGRPAYVPPAYGRPGYARPGYAVPHGYAVPRGYVTPYGMPPHVYAGRGYYGPPRYIAPGWHGGHGYVVVAPRYVSPYVSATARGTRTTTVPASVLASTTGPTVSIRSAPSLRRTTTRHRGPCMADYGSPRLRVRPRSLPTGTTSASSTTSTAHPST